MHTECQFPHQDLPRRDRVRHPRASRNESRYWAFRTRGRRVFGMVSANSRCRRSGEPRLCGAARTAASAFHRRSGTVCQCGGCVPDETCRRLLICPISIRAASSIGGPTSHSRSIQNCRKICAIRIFWIRISHPHEPADRAGRRHTHPHGLVRHGGPPRFVPAGRSRGQQAMRGGPFEPLTVEPASVEEVTCVDIAVS